jgi:hypothetical protein
MFSCSTSRVKLSLCLTNKPLLHDYVWGSVCIHPYFLDLFTICRWVVSFTPRPLYSRENSPPPPRTIGEDTGWNRRAGVEDMEETKSLTLPGLQFLTHRHPRRSQSLYRLSHLGSCSTSCVDILSTAHFGSAIYEMQTEDYSNNVV